MGVVLPNGTVKDVYETIKTDNYMGWKSCTMKEAQAAADNGIATIGISKNKIVIIAAVNEEEPVSESAMVMTLSETSSTNAVSDIQYYSYSNSITTCSFGMVLDKPYDPKYPYTLNGIARNLSREEYYELLSTYSYTVRNDAVFEFTFAEVDSFRSYLVSVVNNTSNQRKKLLNAAYDLAKTAVSNVPLLGAIVDLIDVADIVKSISRSSVEESITRITNYVDKYSHTISGKKSIPKPYSVKYTISLLKINPIGGRMIKIKSSDGDEIFFTVEEGAYDVALLTAFANAHSAIVYKTAPEWVYRPV